VPARGLGYLAQSSERRQLDLFLGVVTLVLLIACANIAGLLIARSTGRRRDLAVRLAMGASRGRIVSQVLAESLVLSAIGGAAGLLVATWGTDLLASLYAHDSAGRPIAFDLSLTATVVLATVALTFITALLSGGAPAWHASRADLLSVLKDEGASGGARRARLRPLLVGAQVAISIVLLVGAALLIESARRAFQGPGLDPDPVITLRLRPSLVDYPRERAHAFQRDVVQALEALPGVISASPSVFFSMFSAGTRILAVDASAPGQPLEAIGNPVGPRYFATMGIAVIEGREFHERDRSGAAPVVVVNDVLARRLWPNGSAVGRMLRANDRGHEIVGVVADAQYYSGGDPPRPQVFFSYWQPADTDAFQNDSRTFVRVAGDAAPMMRDILRAVASVDASVPVSEAYPLRDRVAYAFQPVRLARAMLTSFALLALLLSAVGLYGVLAFSVVQRTREIGIRVALGATRADVITLVMREGLTVTAIGAAVGLFAAWHAAQFVAALLFGLAARELTAFAAATALLLVVALVASYLPARRAAGVSPLAAIRTE
jgi:predicted permease